MPYSSASKYCRNVYHNLGTFSGTGAGSEFDVAGMGFGVILSGGGDRTVDLQGTIDGTNWFDIGTITSTYQVHNNKPVMKIRANCDGGTTGSNTAHVAVHER